MLRKEPFRRKAFSLRNKMSDVRDDDPAFIGRGLKIRLRLALKIISRTNEYFFLSILHRAYTVNRKERKINDRSDRYRLTSKKTKEKKKEKHGRM